MANIALVHDHLFEFGGAERVFLELKKIFPQADVYLAGYKKNVVKRWIPDFNTWRVQIAWVSKIPFFSKLYSPLRFLAPYVWESFDFSNYDVVISSSGWFMSKGVLTKPGTRHISYIHHPPAHLYFYQTAVEWQKYWPFRVYAYVVNHFLRMWDFEASQRPDILVANSHETRRRIQKFYRRDALVIYPPVHIPEKAPSYTKGDYFVTLSRLAFKKHVDLLVRAANEYDFRLKVIGTGRDEKYLKTLAGEGVTFLGYVSDYELTSLYAGAKAFLNASEEEEFGIAPVEAMGHGVPVIACASGGLKETVKEGCNGYLFDELTPQSLYEKILKLEKLSQENYLQMRKTAREESEKYSEAVFARNIKKLTHIE